MPKAALFIINGFEEIEAITVADLLRRASVQTDIVSLSDGISVKGRSNIEVKADKLFKDIKAQNYDMLIIPGGTPAYADHKPFMDVIADAAKSGKKLAAICVAPIVFGILGLLKGKKAVCYPGAEDKLEGAKVLKVPVVTDGNITTSRGPGTSALFALELIRILVNQETADKVKGGILLAA
ncbi:MAG: DJ-1/PfpI family protein [Deltaproteobacteria bacterium]|jgi:4-methyl-5(b-hydroxyethyl)-thiazole monophosphate biosynthesis|nr:DJ-1/PfpI family protein [Deltaproteobacteria bacterium]